MALRHKFRDIDAQRRQRISLRKTITFEASLPILEGFEQIKLYQIKKWLSTLSTLTATATLSKPEKEAMYRLKEGRCDSDDVLLAFCLRYFNVSEFGFVSQGSPDRGALIASVQLLNFVFHSFAAFLSITKNPHDTVKDIEN